MADYAGVNLRRLMAAAGLSVRELAQRSGLDERTVRAVGSGRHRPHGKTLHQLAEGLGTVVDQFFVDPAQLAYQQFDQATNPMVEQVVAEYPQRFRNWTAADFEELTSRMGTGGGLTHDGAIKAADHINRKRQLHEKLDLLLETTHSSLIGEMIDLLHERMAEGVGEQKPLS